MTDRIDPRYTDPVQPHDRPQEVPGIGTSGDENLAKRYCEELDPTQSPMNPKADGDNPGLPDVVNEFFGKGKDLRNRG